MATVFANSAIASFPPESRSAMMPEPTTAARSMRTDCLGGKSTRHIACHRSCFRMTIAEAGHAD